MRNLFRRKFNLGQTCGLIAAVQLLIAGLLISLLIYGHLQEGLRQEQEENGFRQLQRLSLVIAPLVIQQDRVSLNVTLKDWNPGPELSSVRVLDTEGNTLAETGRLTGQFIKLPLTQDNAVFGAIEATVSLETADRTATRYLSLALIATGLCAMLGGLLAYHLAERVSAYVTSLTRNLQAWSAGAQLQAPEYTPSGLTECTELQQVIQTLEQNEARRHALESALNRFVFRTDKPRRQNVTYQRCALLYFEITDLESQLERLTATELAESLEEYHRLLTQAAKLYNGTLDRYQGNGIVMIFGLPDGNERDTLHCIYAAQLCIGLIRQARRKRPVLERINLRCAAHWGPVLLSPVSDGNNTQYSLIGDTLYWTAHLASSSDQNRVLVSQSLVSELPVEIGMEWDEGPGVTNLQGQQQQSFWLRSLPEKSRTLIDRQIHHIAAMTEKA